MSAIRLFFSFFFIVLLAACGPSAERQAVVLQGKTMGTTYTVKYLSDGLKDLPPPEQVQADLDKLLVEVNRQMSTYDPSSEISRFNQLQAVGEPMEISADFAFVTAEAFRLNGLTQGALDVTVGPLVNLWGFGPDKTVTREPTDEQIRQASAVVGTDKIILAGGSGKQTLAKKVAGTYLDLSSIAKGFGVDKLAIHLEGLGVENYLVEIGGELRGRGKNERGETWRIGIEQPQILQGGNTQIVVPLANHSLATSGDYRNFHVDAHGRRLSHIIDPQKHVPINHNLASVSVIADSATTADGLSTALFVLGEQRALQLAEQQGLAVFLIIRDGSGYRTEMSSAFKQLLRDKDKS